MGFSQVKKEMFVLIGFVVLEFHVGFRECCNLSPHFGIGENSTEAYSNYPFAYTYDLCIPLKSELDEQLSRTSVPSINCRQ